MNDQQAKELLETMFNSVTAAGADASVLGRYFTDDFVQIVEDTEIRRPKFDEHLATLRAEFHDMSFEFTTVFAAGDHIADVHFFRASRSGDGGRVAMKFIGIYTLRDGKICRFEELSRLLEGGQDDHDIVTRQR